MVRALVYALNACVATIIVRLHDKWLLNWCFAAQVYHLWNPSRPRVEGGGPDCHRHRGWALVCCGPPW